MVCQQYVSKNYQLNVKKCGKWVVIILYKDERIFRTCSDTLVFIHL